MNLPRIDFGKLVEEKMADNMNIYAAGHKEGYRLGFADGKRRRERSWNALSDRSNRGRSQGANYESHARNSFDRV